jgi:hypothetical protein
MENSLVERLMSLKLYVLSRKSQKETISSRKCPWLPVIPMLGVSETLAIGSWQPWLLHCLQPMQLSGDISL